MNYERVLSFVSKVANKAVDPVPHAKAIAAIMVEYGILTDEQQAGFIGHLAHETGGFRHMEENLNYTSAERIRAVFGKRAANPEKLVRNPQALANAVYGGRFGNTGPNDGWLYRGSGYIHLTFKGNFEKYAKRTGLDIVNNPDLVRKDMNVAAATAAAFWVDTGCNDHASDKNWLRTTQLINGNAALGHAERVAKIESILNIA